MKFLVGNDTHILSKHESISFQNLWLTIFDTSLIPVLNGDIVDMSNCKRKDIDMGLKCLYALKSLCEKKGGALIRGNHELNQIEAPDFALLGGVYFEHGDRGLFWTMEKSDAYRGKQPGSGFLKRSASKYYDVFRDLKPWKPDQMFWDRVDYIVRLHSPKAIVLGHVHPTENILLKRGNVEIHILKRGIHTIDLGAICLTL